MNSLLNSATYLSRNIIDCSLLVAYRLELDLWKILAYSLDLNAKQMVIIGKTQMKLYSCFSVSILEKLVIVCF